MVLLEKSGVCSRCSIRVPALFKISSLFRLTVHFVIICFLLLSRASACRTRCTRLCKCNKFSSNSRVKQTHLYIVCMRMYMLGIGTVLHCETLNT